MPGCLESMGTAIDGFVTVRRRSGSILKPVCKLSGPRSRWRDAQSAGRKSIDLVLDFSEVNRCVLVPFGESLH